MKVVARARPFVRHHRRYERWFEHHRAAYFSELLAVRALLPWSGCGLEIGVGTGRFAGPLGVEFGIDPAAETQAYALVKPLNDRRLGPGYLRVTTEDNARFVAALESSL